MIPAHNQLTLPAGIQDDRATALLELLEQRFGGFPLERLLVYMFEHVPESALPALGWQFDVPPSAWAAANSEQRLALVAQAIAEQRKRGTTGATLRALTKAGGPEAFIQAANDVLYTDGTWYTDGTFDTCSTKGAYWLVLVGATLFPQADLDRYVAIAQEWMRGTAHMFGLYQIPSAEEFGVLVEYERLD